MPLIMKLLFFLFLLFANISVAFCEAQPPSKKLDTTDFNQMVKLPSYSANQTTDSVSTLSARQIDTINQEKVTYTKFVYNYKTRLYNWQLLSSKIIFSVVAIIVLIGLYLSYLQFRVSTLHITGTTNKVKFKKEIESDLPAADHTKIEISKEGIKIDSAVIGLVILTLSIVFFFLYLKFVFPINDNL
jgi:hypothetical protein